MRYNKRGNGEKYTDQSQKQIQRWKNMVLILIDPSGHKSNFKFVSNYCTYQYDETYIG